MYARAHICVRVQGGIIYLGSLDEKEAKDAM